ncbi:basic leucine zipper 43-like [Humulus lupulus]|uniref:basic leucine zipper 43-like n=1 Tax=Humulus lupulus TaxID=3486 RepID=UPI002B409AE7|nr:basic leucine zipper 43-like [Humulus lupulus]
MLPGEFTELYYLPVSPDHHQNPILPVLPNFNNTMITNSTCTSNMDPVFHLNSSFLNTNLPHYPPPQTTSSTLSNNSTSDEAEENYNNIHSPHDHEQMRIIDERRQRRMISNRESARRSRMRKQKHLDELWSQVVRLRTENHSLIDKLNHVSESHDRVLQENSRLKEEASDLRQMLTALQIGSPYNAAVLRTTIHDDDDDDDDGVDADDHDRDLEDMVDNIDRSHRNHNHHHNEINLPCNAAHLRAGTSSTNIATSVDLLH